MSLGRVFISLRLLTFVCAFLSLKAYAQVDITAIPLDKQLVARDLNTNLGTFTIEGEVTRSGAVYDYEYMIVNIFKNGIYNNTVNGSTLSYTNDKADFNISVEIQAELSNYNVEVYGVPRNGDPEEQVVLTAGTGNDIVAGDVYIIQGQSNAEAIQYDGSASAYNNDYIRVFGSATQNTNTLLTIASHGVWNVADGDISATLPGGIGQWGLALADQIIDDHSVPIAIFNGARGGRPIAYFQEGHVQPSAEGSMNNYERLRYRLVTIGLKNNIRAIFWSQGESDVTGGGTTLAQYKSSFEDLKSSWQTDYGVDKIYIFQTKSSCGGAAIRHIQEAQRQLAEEDDNMQLIQTTGLTYYNNCHFSFSGGYEEFAKRLFKLVDRDFYDTDYGTIEIETPRISVAYMEPGNKLIVETNADMLSNNAIPTTVFLLEDPDGATISSVDVVSGTNKIVFQLSKIPNSVATISYLGLGSATNSNNLITNSSDIEIVCFDKFPITWGTTWNGSVWDPMDPNEVQDAVIDGYFSPTNGDIIARNLTVNAGENLNFDSGNPNGNNSIIVYGDLTVNGTMTVGDTESLWIKSTTATVAINGSFTKKEKTTELNNQYDVTYWSSPVSNPNTAVNEVFNAVDPNRIFYYDPKVENAAYTGTYYKYRHWHKATGTMINAKGYSVDGAPGITYPGYRMEVDFEGTPNFEDISINIGRDPQAIDDIDKVNLIGNPYPSAIDANALILANDANFDGALYLWGHQTNYTSGEYKASDYFTYNNLGSSLSAIPDPYYIASGQGFMIITDKVNTSFQFNNDMQVSGLNNNFYKYAKKKEAFVKKVDRIWLRLSRGDDYSKEILLGFSKNTSSRFDKGYDGKLFTSDESLTFYSLLENEKYSIQSLNLFHLTFTVPIGFSVSEEGEYSLGISKVKGDLKDKKILLHDSELGVIHNLNISDYYFDQVDTGDFQSRFILQFEDSRFDLDNPSPKPKFFIINVEDGFEVISEKTVFKLKIYDIFGRLIYQIKPNEKEFKIDLPSLDKGTIVFFKATLNNKSVLSKKCIRI